ncbi:hypothetical protein [Clostridium tarantellae]|uniref:Uncharacterized protein n=1 Tax=Clostridium tarantellae TaxID=39493 RepID=A0A6I1ML01_9CLOT|nr:hypothetical protein [Clostridium tarantellae]MPQ44186.1 hypothetical protein [Clostridium tarantellae]
MEGNKVTKELKIKSFRVDEGIFEKFKQIANENFGNQNQCLDALINLYEMETSKTSLIERKLEIESFQDYLNKINQLFVTSLQLSQDAEIRVREEFSRQLTIKDTTIERLQLKEKDNYDKIVDYKKEIKILKEKSDNLTNLTKELEKDKNTLSQLVSRNYELIENNKKKLEKLNSYKSYKIENEKIKKDLEFSFNESLMLKQEIDKKDSKLEFLQKDIKKYEDTIKDLKEEVKSFKILLESTTIEHKKELQLIEGKYTKIIENEKEKVLQIFKKELELEKKSLGLTIKVLEQEKKELKFQLKNNK